MDFSTSNLILNIVIFLAGTYALIKGSDIFIDSAAAFARAWNVSELVIGLTLVSIGTSLPELATSVYAAFIKDSGFILGNINGSIITNITLILGVSALIAGKLNFNDKLLKRDAVIMNLVFIATGALFYFQHVKCPSEESVHGIDWKTGIFFLAGAVAYCYYLFRNPEIVEEECHAEPCQKPAELKRVLFVEFLFLIMGFVMIFFGSKAMVDTVVWGANRLHIDSMFISATIVAFGTSVPELAVSVAGTLKGRHDIAIGNIIGSCIFNILMIFGVTSIISPLCITTRDTLLTLPMIIATGLLLLVLMFRGRSLTRADGAILLTGYIAFLAYNMRSFF